MRFPRACVAGGEITWQLMAGRKSSPRSNSFALHTHLRAEPDAGALIRRDAPPLFSELLILPTAAARAQMSRYHFEKEVLPLNEKFVCWVRHGLGLFLVRVQC